MIWVGLETLLVGALLGWGVTPLVMRLAHRLGAVDHPDPRKIHSKPIPRVGGVAVFVGFIGALGFAAWATGYVWKFPVGGIYWTTLAGGAASMLLLGLLDDLFRISFQWKFAAQFVAAVAAWIAGFRIDVVSIPFLGTSVDLGWASPLVTVLWIVGITNALNLIDGLDGLAVGSALITSATLAIVAAQAGKVAVTAVCVALSGSLLGFLYYNFNPARIFLGDSGSMFLGFVLAVISIHGSQKRPAVVATLAPLLVLGLPILDTALAIARRGLRLAVKSRREGLGVFYLLRNVHVVFLPDRQHLHHRLLDLGISHRRSVVLLYLTGAAFALIALAEVVRTNWSSALLLLGGVAAGIVLLTVSYHFARVRRVGKKGPKPPSDGGSVGVGGILEETR